MKKFPITTVAAVLGLVCAFVIVLLWQPEPVPSLRDQAPTGTPRQPGPVTASPTTSFRAGAGDQTARILLAALERLFASDLVRPNETVLRFKDDAALARFLARAQASGLTILDRIDALRSVRVRFSDLAALRDELLRNSGDYADASGNFLINVPQIPVREDRPAISQVPFGNSTLAYIGAAGDRTQWGRGVTIAVLDTGVALDATFGSGRVRTLDIGLGSMPGTGEDGGHGTSVASLAAGASPDAAGVAPAANILSIRVTDTNGVSDIFTVAQAIVTAVDAGARVINVSLGGYGTNSTLDAAIQYAQSHGSVIVAAAGNDQAAQLAWPAADPRVVSVGAVDRAGQQVTFSNSGPQLQLSAPGYGVQTAWANGQRAYVDGTSASAPLVSGAIAALISQNPSLSPADAAQVLTQTANDAGAPGTDPAYGHGILNVAWAMNVNNPTYIDTAIASHYFDAANNQMDFVVQNRSGTTVAGLTLSVNTGSLTTTYPISTLTAGQTQVIKMPVDTAQMTTAGRISYATTLTNPAGVVDQVPANNRQSSVLTAPKK